MSRGAQHHIGFFASARSGLGHIQRIANIASALRKTGDCGTISLFCNAEADGVGRTALGAFNHTVVLERDHMARAAQAAGVTVAVSDMTVVPELSDVGRYRVLILRETPDDRIATFSLGRPWDHVLIPNPARHWLPVLPDGYATTVHPVGWIVRQTSARNARDRSAGILLATGGGGTAGTRELLYPVLSRIVQLARAEVSFALRQALGPRSGGEALPEADETFDPGSRLDDVFRRADVVLSTAGYNSVLELAGTDTPTLLAAIPRSFDDQQARVRLWGPKLGHGLEPGREDTAAAWLVDQLRLPRRRAPLDLGPDGAQVAAKVLAQLP